MEILLQEVIAEILPKAMALRWCVHENPELGNQEFETTNRLAQFFRAEGIPFCRFEKLTGGTVLIDAHAEKTVCFRADIDALTITEQTGCLHASKREGTMHACGHDMHLGIAAGLALVLYRLQAHLKYNVLILFQPAEEQNPVGGARPVIDTGIFKEYGVNGIYGLHLWPSLPVGTIGIKTGVQMGASDKFSIDLYGKSAHAAEPHKGVDAISIGADLVNALVHKLRREIDPFETCLVTIGEIRSFGRYNILCDHVLLEGTIRSTTDEARTKIKNRIRELAEGIAHAYGGHAKVAITDGYGLVINHPEQTLDFIRAAKKTLGESRVLTDISISLIGEDFSRYAQVLPATYFFLGCESEYPLHSARFLPDERVLPTALRLMGAFLLNDKIS